MLCGARKPGTCIRLSVKQGETAVVSPKLPAKTQDLYQVICKAGRNRGGVSQITGENPGQHSNYLQSMQKQ